MTEAASSPDASAGRREFPRLLVVGGSDSYGGAGIQADIKTGTLLGVSVSSVISAITAQNSLGVQAVWPVPKEIVAAQLTSVCENIPPHAVKLGMLCDAPRTEAVKEAIQRYRLHPVVCDPVLCSTSGRMLLDSEGKQSLLSLLPQVFLLTPNAHEAAELSGRKVRNVEENLDAGRALLDLGVYAVLLKGGHFEGSVCTDRLLIPEQADPILFSAPRIETSNDHGTGCVLSSAIAAELALGKALPKAISEARVFLQKALQGAVDVWNGDGRGGMNLRNEQHCGIPSVLIQSGPS